MNRDKRDFIIGLLFTIGSILWFITKFYPTSNITFTPDWWMDTIAAITFIIGSWLQTFR